MKYRKASGRVWLATALALTVGFGNTAIAGPNDVNSTNNGQVVSGGTYYNTPGNKTTFTNTGSGGLWVKSGTTVRGLEVSNPADPMNSLTGHGGHLHFSAPGQVVRIDGAIDVSGILGGQGHYLGNGGRVTIDAAYLYQNGHIFANGAKGGTVNFNVGHLTQTRNGRVEAIGQSGAGGQIDAQVSGMADIQRGAIFDASGHNIGTFDRGVIAIEGGLVNMAGVVNANGVVFNQQGSDGGTIRIIATGNTASQNLALTTDAPFTQRETRTLERRLNRTVSRNDGDILMRGRLNVNGTGGYASGDGRAGDGGVITLLANRQIELRGRTEANGGHGHNSLSPVDGGHGGRITLAAGEDIALKGWLRANGGNGGRNTYRGRESDVSAYQGADGGDGGTLSFLYGNELSLTRVLEAKGGNGGHAGGNARSVSRAGNNRTELADAHAEAYGANGGNGGDGGEVVFRGEDNPTGKGSLRLDGGRGGNGTHATATAIARASRKNGEANASAIAMAGQGGKGGDAGKIYASTPESFNLKYQAHQGQGGHSGRSRATAISIGAQSSALANTGSQSFTMETNGRSRVSLSERILGAGLGPNRPVLPLPLPTAHRLSEITQEDSLRLIPLEIGQLLRRVTFNAHAEGNNPTDLSSRIRKNPRPLKLEAPPVILMMTEQSHLDNADLTLNPDIGLE